MPDSFEEHIKLMFDLQAIAFASDITRVFAFKLGRDAFNRVYPRQRCQDGVPLGVRTAGIADRIRDFEKSTATTSACFPFISSTS